MNARVTNLTGRQGGTFINSSDGPKSAPSGKAWHAFEVVEETVLAAVQSNLENDSRLVGPTLPVGYIQYGGFTQLHVSTGLICAFLE